MIESKIRGVEHELAMNTQPPLPYGSLVHLVGMAIEELKRIGLVTKVTVEGESLDYVARNGFRVYNDMSHLELSSPSYNSPFDAVVYDKVMELFTLYAIRSLKGYFKGINAYKNNISNLDIGEAGQRAWRAVSYSTHASYLLARSVCNLDIWNHLEDALIPFMVTRVPLIGGGDFVPVPNGGGFSKPGKEIFGQTLAYVISPRAMFSKRLSSNDTVSARGLLNQRDEPHADPLKYWRLHDINWEGLRSPFQIYMRDSLETLVLLAYEKKFLKNPPKLVDPVKSIKEISLKTESCDWKVTLAGGEKEDALRDIMEGFYLAGVEKMLDEFGSSSEDIMGFNIAEATTQTLAEGRLEYLIDGLDWITKKVLLDEYASSDFKDCLSICNQYSLIDETVLGYIGECRRNEEVHTMFDLKGSMDFARDAIPLVDWDSFNETVERGLTYGPEGTREYIRSLVAREFPDMAEQIEWERITFPNVKINLYEPFMLNKEMCGDILENATTNLASFLNVVNQLVSEARIIRTPIEDYELRG